MTDSQVIIVDIAEYNIDADSSMNNLNMIMIMMKAWLLLWLRNDPSPGFVRPDGPPGPGAFGRVLPHLRRRRPAGRFLKNRPGSYF